MNHTLNLEQHQYVRQPSTNRLVGSETGLVRLSFRGGSMSQVCAYAPGGFPDTATMEQAARYLLVGTFSGEQWSRGGGGSGLQPAAAHCTTWEVPRTVR